MARAATVSELTKLRSAGQFSRLYLAIDTPAVVFKALINQVFSTLDKVAEIAFDTVTTGAYTDVQPDMTVYIGSSEGAYDIGMVRVRKAPTSSALYIGETSELPLADNLYITVVDEYGIWPRQIKIAPDGVTPLMDFDVTYSDQHDNTDPTPVLGMDVVLWLTGSTVSIQRNGANSFCVDGSSISSYSWSAPGASATSGLTTATPTLTYNAAGRYLVSCVVTASNGKSYTGRRNVYVFSAASMPVTQFELESCSGSYAGSGWQFRVRLFDQATRAEIRDRAKVILFARDWYNNVEESLGPQAGGENIVCTGWIDGESIEMDPVSGEVSFDVYGPQYWLGVEMSFPAGLQDTDFAGNGGGAPNRWIEFADLTVDKAAWHLLHWRSTVTRCLDIGLTNDTRTMAQISSASGTLLGQLLEILQRTILALPCCDRYGRLYCEVDTQLIPSADRASIPTVMTLGKTDYQRATIRRTTVNRVSKVELSGTVYNAGHSTPIGAMAPGDVYARFGEPDERTELALASQAQALILAGLALSQANNEYPEVILPLAANNRMVDVAPRQRLAMSLASTDTERGIVWSGLLLLPRDITAVIDDESNFLGWELVCEGETDESQANVMTFPGGGGEEPPPGTVTPPTPPPTPPPPVTPPPVTNGSFVVCTQTQVKVCLDIEVGTPVWLDKTGSFVGNIVDGSPDINDSSHNTYYVATETRIYRTANLLSTPPTWTEIYDAETEFPGLDPEIRRIVVVEVPGYGANVRVRALIVTRASAGSTTGVVRVVSTLDGGANWTDSIVWSKPIGVEDFRMDLYTLIIPQLGAGVDYYSQPGVVRRDGAEPISPWGVVFKVYPGFSTPPGLSNGFVPYHEDPDVNTGVWELTLSIGSHPYEYISMGNTLLSAGERVILSAYITAHFGAIGVGQPVKDLIYPSMPKNAARTIMSWASVVNDPPSGDVPCYIIWRKTTFDIQCSFDNGRNSADVFFVGTEDGIYRTGDGGLNYALWIPDQVALDIHCPRAQDYLDYNILFWNDLGELYSTWRQTLNIVRYTETPNEQHLRIASDPGSGLPNWILAGTGADTYSLVKAVFPYSINHETKATGISQGRSLRCSAGQSVVDRLIYYLDASSIRYSADYGATIQNKTGNWSGFSGPVCIHSLVTT